MVADGIHSSVCRFCHCNCPLQVTVEGGAVTRVRGDPRNTIFKGFSCIKGRQVGEQLTHPDRLRHSLKRMPDGSHRPIPVEDAMDEIAEKFRILIDRYGPRAIANYSGTHAFQTNPFTNLFALGFMAALGSPWQFDTLTIDQPGKFTARGLHGAWQALATPFREWETALMIGVNPWVSFAGAPGNNVRWQLHDAQKRGTKIIIVDPRKTETGRFAALHLQAKPAADIPILAAIINLAITEKLYDSAFVEQHTTGIAALYEAVRLFTPEIAAQAAGIPADKIVEAARLYFSGRGGAIAGTGPSMCSARSTLLEYLMLCINTLNGAWQRAGETSWAPGVLGPEMAQKAQATPPFAAYDIGEQMVAHGLKGSLAGLPTGYLPEQMLADDDNRIRALISAGGNPIVAWPDQIKTRAGIDALDVFVQIDAFWSASARVADYVIAPKMALEIAGSTLMFESLPWYAHGSGWTEPHAQYAPALMDPPAGSETISDWAFYFGIAQRLGLELAIPLPGLGAQTSKPIPLDMNAEYTEDSLLELVTQDSRIPLAKVKSVPEGRSWPEPAMIVGQREEGWEGRLDLGNRQMMSDLVDEFAVLVEIVQSHHGSDFPLRLIPRRLTSRYNSNGHGLSQSMKRDKINAAYLHPNDLTRLGLESGEYVEIVSARGAIHSVVEPDEGVREGLVSMAHCFGGLVEEEEHSAEIGAPTGRLFDLSQVDYDRYTGQPLMGNLPITIRKTNGPPPEHTRIPIARPQEV